MNEKFNKKNIADFEKTTLRNNKLVNYGLVKSLATLKYI